MSIATREEGWRYSHAKREGREQRMKGLARNAGCVLGARAWEIYRRTNTIDVACRKKKVWHSRSSGEERKGNKPHGKMSIIKIPVFSHRRREKLFPEATAEFSNRQYKRFLPFVFVVARSSSAAVSSVAESRTYRLHLDEGSEERSWTNEGDSLTVRKDTRFMETEVESVDEEKGQRVRKAKE